MSVEEIPSLSLPPEITQTETWDTVKETTETDITPPKESPPSLYARAYEAVGLKSIVEHVTDHVRTWYIYDTGKDIASLEARYKLHMSKADVHEARLQTNDEVARKLATVKETLKIQPADERTEQQHESQRQAVESQAQFHRRIAESLARELDQKKSLKAEYESLRDGARGRIVGEFELKIADNQLAIDDLNSNKQEIEKHMNMAYETISSLSKERDSLKNDLDQNPDILPETKKDILQAIQEIDRRIGKADAGIKEQNARINTYNAKKSALESESALWKAKVAKKEKSWGRKKEDGDVAQHGIAKPIDTGIELTGETPEAGEQQDPRATLLEEMQSLMANPELQRYNDAGFQELVLENGTPEQNLLLQTNGFFTKLFDFLESRAEPQQETKKEKVIEKNLTSKKQLDPVMLAHAYDEIIDSVDDPNLESLFDTKKRKQIEQGNGTPEQSLLIKLLDFFEYLFKSLEIRPESNGKKTSNNPL
ncbi:MAG TPA: hypothetical protein VLG69_03535 [Candidatus Andersenbacteria bacterium]|nr:hypothetical protein [Candidatus Andersenbacteria bacterium]